MDWNELFNNAWTWVASLGISGATLGIVAVKTFVFDRLGASKVQKLMNFAAYSNQTMETARASFDELKGKIEKEIVSNLVEPILSTVESLKTDNAMLANVAVSALSQLNVPVEQKESLMAVIVKTANVSTEAQLLLQKSIDAQKATLLSKVESNADLSDEIEKS